MNSTKGCLTIFFIPFVITTIGMLFLSISSLIKAQQTRKWIPVEATVQNVERKGTTTKKGNYQTKTYVTYKYDIGGNKYEGCKISIDNNFNFSKDQEPTIFDKISSAKVIRIFINPKNANDAVIVRGFSKNLFYLFLTTIISSTLVFGFATIVILAMKNVKTIPLSLIYLGRFALALSIISLILLIGIATDYIDISLFKIESVTENIVVLEER